MEWGNPLLDDHVLSLTGVACPRVCFLPTASGDADHYVVRFYRAFPASRCQPSHISLFRRETGVGDPYAHLQAQDLIYVGGGSLVSLLGTWQAHGIDLALYDAWRSGVVLCGGSAGSLCWFTDAISGFHEGPPRRLEGLGFLPWSNAVHYSDEPGRRSAFMSAVAGGMAAGLRGGGRRGPAFRGHGVGGGGRLAPRCPRALRVRRRCRRREGGRSHCEVSRRSRAAPRRVTDGGDDRRRILAMGGGGFTMQDRSASLDRLVLTLTGKPVPRICFLPTASGDGRDQTTRFQERFSGWPCEPSVLSLFHLGRDRIDPRAHLLSQDAIYVGGGSMRNMLAVWREHGVDQAMRSAWERGVVLAGLSAGAMCWFESGITMSGGAPRPAAGLGLIEGSLSVHLDGEPERLPAYREAVGSGAVPPGFAVDDFAALLVCGTEVREAVSSRPGARVLRVEADGEGGTVERPMSVRVLPGAVAADAPVGAGEPRGVSELRALRAGRHRWD